MTQPTPFPDELYMSDFGYDLTEEKIARFPLQQRDASKLLVWESGKIRRGRYAGIGHFLPSPCLLVFNNSRVVEARILFQKTIGWANRNFLSRTSHRGHSITDGMNQTGSVFWICLIGGASKWKRHQVLVKEYGEIRLEARFVEKRMDDFLIEFSWTPRELPFASILHQLGSIPLPPYLKRPADISDAEKISNRLCKRIGICSCSDRRIAF
ncbi:MAG: S-adenosylmethionine:tRNA ribosyltransferase-isomerase [Puia sp.]